MKRLYCATNLSLFILNLRLLFLVINIYLPSIEYLKSDKLHKKVNKTLWGLWINISHNYMKVLD